MKFYYVYVLESEVEPDRHNVGFTKDLRQRFFDDAYLCSRMR